MNEKKLRWRVSIWIFAILFLVVTAVYLPDRAEAKTLYKGKDGGLSWTISDKGKLVIKGSGDYVGCNISAICHIYKSRILAII